ncbi:GTPase IMAP family member 7 [Lampris incognitus]|uniref:GTPase IMAP family member 7 n=1 Tax=Lampris incognitus TaxID=2546036 RepID=UPI0024B5FAD6|nr:GTPase IMAP family member 7 [Lampris incognitus]
MASGDSRTELKLVLLGRAGAGQSSACSTILGLQGFGSQHAPEDAVIQECHKHKGDVAGRQVIAVTTPDWFSSGCNPEEARHHISSFVAFSTPGPHAFLLCVPANQPADGEPKALDALEKIFGPSAVSGHTIVLFTQTDELDEGEQLEEHLITQRKDLLELVERCGDRFDTLKKGSSEEEERKTVEELLEKVEQAVKESGTEHFSCPLYQEAEARVRQRQEEIVRENRERSGTGEEEVDGQEDPAGRHPKEDTDDRDMEKAREEAERSINDLSVDIDNIFPSTSVSASHLPPSFLWGLWEMLTGWMKRLPKLVRKEALLGSLLGLFVGGPFGGMLGATVGSIATEVGRRKTQKNK